MQTMTPFEVPQRWEQLRQLVIDNHEPVRIETSPTDRAILLAETDYQRLIDTVLRFNHGHLSPAEVPPIIEEDNRLDESSQLFEHLEIYRLVKSREYTGADQYLDHQEILTRFGVTENDLCD